MALVRQLMPSSLVLQSNLQWMGMLIPTCVESRMCIEEIGKVCKNGVRELLLITG